MVVFTCLQRDRGERKLIGPAHSNSEITNHNAACQTTIHSDRLSAVCKQGSARLIQRKGVLVYFTSITMAFLPTIEQLAIPAVSALIFFLAYTSQYLFYCIDPGPLTKAQALWFNGFVLAIWWCYDRACSVDPGRQGWVRRAGLAGDEDDGEDIILEKGKKWCRKCETVKPPRAHHCRQCGR